VVLIEGILYQKLEEDKGINSLSSTKKFEGRSTGRITCREDKTLARVRLSSKNGIKPVLLERPLFRSIEPHCSKY